MRKVIDYIMFFIFLWVFFYISFIIWLQVIYRFFPDLSDILNNIIIFKIEKKIYVIEDEYKYVSYKPIYIYYKSWNELIVKEYKNFKFKREYEEIKNKEEDKRKNKREDKEKIKIENNFSKLDKIYDFIEIKWKTFDIHVNELNNIKEFNEKLESISIAPYYDISNNTLYIFAHSSWKPILNIWREFYKLKLWDIVKLYDIQKWIEDSYKVVNKFVLTKQQFKDRFLSWKDKIVLVTCYPLFSNKKRLIIVLKKINN